MRIHAASMLALVALIVACDRTDSTGTEPTGPSLTLNEEGVGVSPEISLDASNLVEAMRSRFRIDGEAFSARQLTYDVFAADGRVRVTPKGWVQEGARDHAVLGAAFELETAAILRGDVSFDLGTGRTDIGQDGSVRIDRGVALEQLETKPVGAEQSWRFDQAPVGSGDLVVRVAAIGLRYRGTSDEGVHFLDEVSGLGMRYGHATWIDGANTTVEIPVFFEAETGELVMRVAAAVLEASVFPAVLDPVVSAETVATTNVASAPSAFSEEFPRVAFDGTNYFGVWGDIRNGDSYDVYGAFVSTGQVVQNSTGILIASAIGHQQHPAVAFNGTDYLVVWDDYRRSTSTTDVVDIYAQRVDTTGALVGGQIAISTTGNAGLPRVAANGTDWFVAWEEHSGGNSNVRFSRVTSGGAADASTALSGAPANQTRPTLACTGSGCLVAFVNGVSGLEDIHGQRIQASTLVDAASFTISGPGNGRSLLPDIAYDGASRYLAVWQDGRNGGFDIIGNRIDAATGMVVDGTGRGINTSAGLQQAPTMVFSGGQYVVAWFDDRTPANGRDIYFTRVTSTATVVDVAGRVVTPRGEHQDYPAITAGGGQFFVVWQDQRGGPPTNLRGTRIAASGAVADTQGTTLATAANRQTSARGVYDGAGNYFIVFTDSQISGGDNYEILGLRVRYDGVVLDPGARIISIAAGTQSAPEIAFDGTNFLIVWQDARNGSTNTDVYGGRVRASDFARLDGDGFAISAGLQNETTPTVSWNSGVSRYMVTWADRRTTTRYDVYGARVTSAGAVVDAAGLLINNVAGDKVRPAVASNNVGWLVAWTDRRNGANTDDVRACVLSGTGTRVANNIVVSTAANIQDSPRIVYTNNNGNEYFVVFRDTRTSLYQSSVYGGRVTTAGAVLSGSGIALASSASLQESRPDVAVMGSTLFVTWQQQTGTSSEETDIVARLFTFAGATSGPAFTIANGTGSERMPAVIPRAADRALVAYQRFISVAPLSAERIRFRLVSLP